MRCPTLAEFPPPPPGKIGWPWTTESLQVPYTMPDGKSWPRLSIVTPSYNQGQYVEETIRSVLLQGYPNLEYFLIDGGSTDGSVETIRKYERWLTNWVSEKDRGQAHAINKGWKLSSGDIFQWINSDDVLLPNVLSFVAARCPKSGALAAAVEAFDDAETRDLSANLNLNLRNLVNNECKFRQPGLWLSLEASRACFPLDETLHYAFDWKMLWDLLVTCPCVDEYSKPTTRFRLHSGSKTVSQAKMWVRDGNQIYEYLLRERKFAMFHSKISGRYTVLRARQRFDEMRAGVLWQLLFGYLGLLVVNPTLVTDRYMLGGLRNAVRARIRLRQVP
jgi:glycosyltransferase involved in cell wall biosynthesis